MNLKCSDNDYDDDDTGDWKVAKTSKIGNTTTFKTSNQQGNNSKTSSIIIITLDYFLKTTITF